MNAVTEAVPLDQTKIGIYNKFHVSRTDGSSEPGGKHHGDEYFVLNLTTDKHALSAIASYADSCAQEFPLLATDLRAKLNTAALEGSIFVVVPEVTLPNGVVVPSFKVGKYLSSRSAGEILQVTAEGAPWVEIDYADSIEACKAAGGTLITELQYLAIAHDIANQPSNWTGGKVGDSELYRGLHTGDVDEAQPGTFESSNLNERRWHVLSNGETVFDFSGNAYSWVFDDVQGDESGIVAKPFAKDSPSITTAPFPSMEKGVGWIPKAGSDRSGLALVRGGCWNSDGRAGVFVLYSDWPDGEDGYVGFRCTKSLG